jgi:hypothetical protein
MATISYRILMAINNGFSFVETGASTKFASLDPLPVNAW